jgi:hypothetical protein
VKVFGIGIIFPVLLVLLSSCTPPVVMLVNPRNGDTRRCSRAEVGAASDEYVEATRIRACVHQWRSLGYVESEKLTAEQRARYWPESSQR